MHANGLSFRGAHPVLSISLVICLSACFSTSASCATSKQNIIPTIHTVQIAITVPAMHTLAEEEAFLTQQYNALKCYYPNCSFVGHSKLGLKRHHSSEHPMWNPNAKDSKSLRALTYIPMLMQHHRCTTRIL